MANINIKFNGKEFLLSCEDGQEDHLEELLIHINQLSLNQILPLKQMKVFFGNIRMKQKLKRFLLHIF